jgi:hypothetical protein
MGILDSIVSLVYTFGCWAIGVVLVFMLLVVFGFTLSRAVTSGYLAARDYYEKQKGIKHE